MFSRLLVNMYSFEMSIHLDIDYNYLDRFTYISNREHEHSYRHRSPYTLFEQRLHICPISDVYPMEQAINKTFNLIMKNIS